MGEVVEDRGGSNNGIDVFSSKTNSFVERIGAGLFAGATPSNGNAGPNGIGIFQCDGRKVADRR